MIISTTPIATRTRPQLHRLQPDALHGVRKVSSAESKRKESPSTRPGIRTSVRFNETVAVRPITHVDDLSDDDLDALWFTRDDFAKMKRSFSNTTKLISQGLYAEDEDHICARGLEHRTKCAARNRRRTRWHAIGAVLLEQRRQRNLGIRDDELISEAYTEENLRCRLVALRLGVQDQKQAEAIWLDAGNDMHSDKIVAKHFQRVTKAALLASTRRNTASRSPLRR